MCAVVLISIELLNQRNCKLWEYLSGNWISIASVLYGWILKLSLLAMDKCEINGQIWISWTNNNSKDKYEIYGQI